MSLNFLKSSGTGMMPCGALDAIGESWVADGELSGAAHGDFDDSSLIVSPP